MVMYAFMTHIIMFKLSEEIMAVWKGFLDYTIVSTICENIRKWCCQSWSTYNYKLFTNLLDPDSSP